jgi:hypothetical protein
LNWFGFVHVFAARPIRYLAFVGVSSVLIQNSHWSSPAIEKIYPPVSGAYIINMKLSRAHLRGCSVYFGRNITLVLKRGRGKVDSHYPICPS